MKQVVVAKLSGKSRSYVAKVSCGIAKDTLIEDLLRVDDKDFLYSFLSNPLIIKVCEGAIMGCKKVQEKRFAAQLQFVCEKIQRSK